MRQLNITEGEYYHICNRGVLKQPIFRSQRDYLRFLFCVIHFQSPLIFPNVNDLLDKFSQNFEISGELIREISLKRTVELVAFIFMPNHFHLLVQELKSGGISTYLQRLLNSHTKYMNAKSETSGHLFQGPFRLVHIEDNEQLLHTTAYIHRNCRELSNWKDRESIYPWSSYPDYIGLNRWNDLLARKIVLEQFQNQSEYERWTRESDTKEFDDIDPLGDFNTN